MRAKSLQNLGASEQERKLDLIDKLDDVLEKIKTSGMFSEYELFELLAARFLEAHPDKKFEESWNTTISKIRENEDEFNGLTYPVSPGRLIITERTRMSPEEVTRMKMVERRSIFCNFKEEDQGRSRERIGQVTTPTQAEIISSALNFFLLVNKVSDVN